MKQMAFRDGDRVLSRFRALVQAACIGWMMLLVSCSGGDDVHDLTPPSILPPALIEEELREIRRLYGRSIMNENIDLLHALITLDLTADLTARVEAADCPMVFLKTGGPLTDMDAFRACIMDAFRANTFTDIQIVIERMDIQDGRASLYLLEVESYVPNAEPAHYTRAFRTRFDIKWQVTDAETPVNFQIIGVERKPPLFTLITPGQVSAVSRTRLISTHQVDVYHLPADVAEGEDEPLAQEPFLPSRACQNLPGTAAPLAFRTALSRYISDFSPRATAGQQTLCVRVASRQDDPMFVHHHFKVQSDRERVVRQVAETGAASFSTVALDEHGRAWFGGELHAPRTSEEIRLGTIALVDGQTGCVSFEQPTIFFNDRLLTPPEDDRLSELPEVERSRIEDIAIDSDGRLHALFLAENAQGNIVGNGIVVRELTSQDTCPQPTDSSRQWCQTANVFDDGYPFRVRDHSQPETPIKRSPSTRLLAAEEREVWLFGSDGGLSRVKDQLKDGKCSENAAAYPDPLFRRDDNALLINTVPALIVEPNDKNTLRWLGTAVGVNQPQNQEFMAFHFDENSRFQGNAEERANLEGLIRDIARNLFELIPHTIVNIGGMQLEEPLTKQDFIFSAVEVDEDHHPRLWLGTLGGGIWRLDEACGQTLHLTRADGLISNLIFDLEPGENNSLWAATDEGVSHIHPPEDTENCNPVDPKLVRINTYSALHGIKGRVRDIAYDPATQTAWLATTEGIFQIVQQGSTVAGSVFNAQTTEPVVGVEVTVPGTTYHAITDTQGRFTLANLPPGPHLLHFDGRYAEGETFLPEFHAIAVEALHNDVQPLPNVVLHPATDPTDQDNQISLPNPVSTGVLGTSLDIKVELSSRQETPLGRERSLEYATLAKQNYHQGLWFKTIQPQNGEIEFKLDIDDEDLYWVVIKEHEGLASLVFTVSGVTAKPVLVAGNNQLAVRKNWLPKPMVARVEDSAGNALANTKVAISLNIDKENCEKHGCVQPTDAPMEMDGSTTLTLNTDDQGDAAFCLQVGQRVLPVEVTPEPSNMNSTASFQPISLASLASVAVEPSGSVVIVDDVLGIVVRLNNDPTDSAGPEACRTPGPNLELISGCIRQDGEIIVQRGEESGALNDQSCLLRSPIDIAIDPWDPVYGTALLVLDHLPNSYLEPRLIRVDPNSGNRDLISGMGQSFDEPVDLAITPDAIYVVDSGLRAVIRVDRLTGARSPFSGCVDMPCPPPQNGEIAFSDPLGIAVLDADSLVVADRGLRAILRVDRGSGALSVLSGCVGSDCPPNGMPKFSEPTDIAVTRDGSMVVIDGTSFEINAAVFRVMRDGTRSILSSINQSSGPAFDGLKIYIDDVEGAMSDDNILVIRDSSQGDLDIVRVNSVSGNRLGLLANRP